MIDIATFLTIVHIIGTSLGVGGALFVEVFYTKALKDGEIDPSEGRFLKTTYFILRIGMVLLVLSGVSMLIYYRLTDQSELLYDERLWAKFTIVLIILINALLLQLKKIPMWLGSSVSFTSWHAALILGILRGVSYDYVSIMFIYMLAVIIMAFILEGIRKIYLKNNT